MRTIVSRTTDTLSEEEIAQIVEGFNDSMANHHVTRDDLMVKYHMGVGGVSYHSLCYEDDNVIGFISAIPYHYNYNGVDVLIALTCDIFVREAYRSDFTLFAKLYQNLKENCLKESIVCFLGVANDNAYTYSVRILRCKEIMTLPYWILPVRIGNVAKKSWMKPFNFLMLGYAYLSLGVNRLCSIAKNSESTPFACTIRVDDEFINRRLPDSKYSNHCCGDYFFSYVVTNDEGIRCAYIMMFSEKGKRTYKSLCKCVSFILRNEKVDMVMFNGTLNLKQGLLIKTPQKFEPRKIHLTVNYLTKEYEKQYADIMKPNGIDFTLLNLDVR